MATITFEFDAGRTDLKASRQRASDDAYWNFTAGAYEDYDAGNVADYGTALTESPSGTYTATAPDLSAAVAHVDRLYAQSGDLTAADLDLWLTEESSEAEPLPPPGTLGTPDPERVWWVSTRGGPYAVNPLVAFIGAREFYGLDLTELLPTGVTVASITPPTVDGLTIAAAEVNTETFTNHRRDTVAVGEGVLLDITPATAGRYLIEFQPALSDGQTPLVVCDLRVKDA